MRRRDFLKAAGASAAGTCALASGLYAGAPRQAGRPNLLFAIADDHSWPHCGAYGDPVVRTPAFDRLAREGVVFGNAFVATPSCTPSRGAILTGQMPHRLADNANLWSRLHRRFEVYPDLLEAAGYVVGHERKGWGPGTIEGTGRTRNPAGPRFRNFEQFLRTVPEGRPFCYWLGSYDPHRPYAAGSGRRAGMDLRRIVVPPFLPDNETIRSDIADYYLEVQRFDRDVGRALDVLDRTGKAGNTLVVMTSDNGMPFPRAKANLYEYGVHMPLAVRWPARVRAGRRLDALISFTDFAPTFLQAAGLQPRPQMTGRSFLDLLVDQTRQAPAARDKVFLERERHAWCRANGVGYPCRAIRTRQFLYIRNLEPDRWPAGDPPGYGDIDGSPSKSYLLQHRNEEAVASLFRAACERRPAEELFDLRRDPTAMTNVAERPEHAAAKRQLRAELDRHMAATEDPRATGGGQHFDRYPYVPRERRRRPPRPRKQ